MNIRGVHHIGIVVRSARDAARSFEEVLGLRVVYWEDYGPGLLRIGFLPVGRTLVELIEPLQDEFNARWLRERGEGIQHIAVEVDDIDGAIRELIGRGVPMRNLSPCRGAGETLVAFLGVEIGGVLIELTQPVGEARWRASQ